MQRTVLLLSLLVLISTDSIAQENNYLENTFYEGQITHSDGTTETGFVEYSNRSDRYEKVNFRQESDGKSKRYKLKDLKGYTINDDLRFVAIEYEDVMFKGRGFLALQEEGCISIYYKEVYDDEKYTWDKVIVMVKGDEAINYQKFAFNFSKSFSEFISDDSELAAKVSEKEKGYGMLKMFDIVEEYNERCEKR